MEKVSFVKSRESLKDYIKWRTERVRQASNKIQQYKLLSGAIALDIGCGYGSFTKILSEKCKRVIATETDAQKIIVAKKILKKQKNVKIIKVNGEKLPVRTASIDIICLFDVIEHVNKPEKMISECRRVLKPDGIIYIEFTPYYSITGHHLYDFFKFPIHIFPQPWVKKLLYAKKNNTFFTHDYFWNLFLSLNKLKIQTLKKSLSNLTNLDEQYIIKYPEIFEVNIPALRYLGILQEYLTMSFVGIYKNKHG